jgi:hypothetical protein
MWRVFNGDLNFLPGQQANVVTSSLGRQSRNDAQCQCDDIKPTGHVAFL